MNDAGSAWSFWWRWVLATNLGWIPGITLGLGLSSRLPDDQQIMRACLAAIVAALFFGGAQSVVLRRFFPGVRGWWLATLVGWPIGVGVAEVVLSAFAWGPAPLARMAAVAFISGGVVGMTQATSLVKQIDAWWCWPAVSAVGWGILFPGAVAGLVLAREARPIQRETN